MDKKDIPAFPRIERVGINGVVSADGMTLRDYFAAKAMQGICAHDDTWGLVTDEIAAKAYLIANAMLAAREGKS